MYHKRPGKTDTICRISIFANCQASQLVFSKPIYLSDVICASIHVFSPHAPVKNHLFFQKYLSAPSFPLLKQYNELSNLIATLGIHFFLDALMHIKLKINLYAFSSKKKHNSVEIFKQIKKKKDGRSYGCFIITSKQCCNFYVKCLPQARVFLYLGLSWWLFSKVGESLEDKVSLEEVRHWRQDLKVLQPTNSTCSCLHFLTVEKM